MNRLNSRKQERKRKRNEKKQKRNDLYQARKLLIKKREKLDAWTKRHDKVTKSKRTQPSSHEAKENRVRDIKMAKRKKISFDEKEKYLCYFKSQLNRLSVSNLSSIVQSIYKNFTDLKDKKLLYDSLIAIFLEAVDCDSALLDLHIMVHAALLTCLTHLTNASLLNLLIKSILLKLKAKHFQADNRGTLNLVTFISYLFEFRILGSNLIIELVLLCLDQLKEKSAEIILKLLRICVPQLRRSEPDSLLLLTTTLLNKMDQNYSDNSRFKFIIESIKDIKNNIFKLKNVYQKDIDDLKDSITNIVHQSFMVKKMEPVNTSLDSFLAYNFEEIDNAASSSRGESDSKLLDLSHAMDSVKDQIIKVLINSSDYIDAFQRLIDLKLNNSQEREIVFIMMNCLACEKLYNPFYAFLAEKLIEYKHNFQVTIKYFLKDFLKENINSSSYQKTHHIGKFYRYLFQKGKLNKKDLVLPSIDLSEMAKKFIFINFDDFSNS